MKRPARFLHLDKTTGPSIKRGGSCKAGFNIENRDHVREDTCARESLEVGRTPNSSELKTVH